MTTTTPEDPVVLITKLGEAAKALADAEKTRAEADKQRADAEKIRADLEAEQRLGQNKLDAAAEDLETKRIANWTARDQAVGARTDKLIEQLTGAVPDLTSIEKSSVSFREGTALRQGEAIAVALAGAAVDVANAVVAAAAKARADTVFVTTDPDLITAVAACRQLGFEANLLEQRVRAAIDAAKKALKAKPPRSGGPVRELLSEAAIVGAAVAGKTITQLASLVQIDVDVATDTTELTAGTVQAAVMQQLVATSPELKVQHAWTRIASSETSALLKSLENLTTLDVDATTVGAQLDAAIKSLGDPAAKLAKAEKVQADEKATEQAKVQAAKDEAEARRDAPRLAALQAVSTDLVALLAKARSFADRITTLPETGGPSALARAVAIEPLTVTDDKVLVLCLAGGKAETNQMVVKRRIWWPRIQTSTAVEVDYLLVSTLDGQVWGGHAAAAVTNEGVINGKGLDWKVITPYTVPSAEVVSGAVHGSAAARAPAELANAPTGNAAGSPVAQP
jgi:hypothetical protein